MQNLNCNGDILKLGIFDARFCHQRKTATLNGASMPVQSAMLLELFYFNQTMQVDFDANVMQN